MLVAVIDDHEELRVALGRLIRSAGYDVALFESAEAYLDAQPLTPACMVIDIHLRGMSGVDLQRHLRAHRPVPSIILTTADPSLLAHAVEFGVDAVLFKPTMSESLLPTISALSNDASPSRQP